MAEEKYNSFYASAGLLGEETKPEETTTTTEDVDTVANQEFTDEDKETPVETPEEQLAPTEEPKPEEPTTTTGETVEEPKPFEFKNEKSKTLFENLAEKKLDSVHEILDEVYGWKKKSPDQLVVDFLKESFPDHTEEELALELEERGYEGLQPLTDEEKELLSEKEIAKHEKDLEKDKLRYNKIVKEAKSYFSQREAQLDIELPDLLKTIQQPEKPKELEEYNQFLSAQKEAEERQSQWEQTVDSTVVRLEDLKLVSEIALDEGKVAYESTFKLNAEDKKELSDFLKTYTPTQREVKQFTLENGEVDVKGFTEYVAKTKVFSEQIQKAALKDAVMAERKKMLADLKNIQPTTQADTQITSGEDWAVMAMKAGRR